MPEFHSTAAANAANAIPGDAFVAAYIMAIYFTETGDGEQPNSEITMAPEAVAQTQRDCDEFRKVASHYLDEAYAREGYDESRAGHDFWLTRNRHGAGFWDRKELYVEDSGPNRSGLGDCLTTIADSFGPCDAYEGDDGLLYLA